MGLMNNVVYLTEQQLQTLISDGTITVGGNTITYSPNDLYVTPALSRMRTSDLINDSNFVDETQMETAIANETTTAVTNAMSYSTEEIATGGTWIDGRPVYRRTLTTTVSANTLASVSLGTEAALIINWYGTLVASGNSMRPINWYHSSTLYNEVYTYQSGSNIAILCREAGTVYLTVEYTKTSDPLPS